MPIQLTNYNFQDFCWGNSWEIQDEELLAQLVAKVLIGYQHHVIKILQGVGIGNGVNLGQHALHDAIEKLTVPPGEPPYHRDGLIFQIFSWIVATKSAGVDSIILKPHLIPAQKGFDGLQVKINPLNHEVEAVIIFEDKATTSPRDTIRNKVWPEFRTFEAGERESELMQETVGLISQRPDLIVDVDQTIEKLIWNKVRFYRVAITAAPEHLSEEGLRALFKNYQEVVISQTNLKRQGEVIHIPDLRNWMNNFSDKVVAQLNALGAAYV